MAISQNVRFCYQTDAEQDFNQPPGASIGRLLKAGIAVRGWVVSEMENWRDTGWNLTIDRGGSKLEVAFAKDATSLEWILQIAPVYAPGLFGSLFGKAPSASSAVVFDLAKAVHSILSEEGHFANLIWCWDGFPKEGASTSEPVQAEV